MNCEWIDDEGIQCSTEIDTSGKHNRRLYCDLHRAKAREIAQSYSHHREKRNRIRRVSPDWPERRAAIIAKYGIGH